MSTARTPGDALRAALEATVLELTPRAGAGATAGAPLRETGRPLVRGVYAPESAVGPIALAWGALEPDELRAWLGALEPGAVAAQVVPIARGGARGALDRVLLLPSRQRPEALEDVCTALFVAGVRSLRVHEIDPTRNVVVVLGRRDA